MSGEIRVETPNPDALNTTLRQLPMAHAYVVHGSWDGTTCTVKVEGDEKFIRYAITNQGYGKVVD